MNGIFDGRNKALTFSFDDGNMDDIRLIALLDKYGLKGTFNLNSGSITSAARWRFNDEKEVFHINYTDHAHLFDGHEIACHTYSHPDLTKLDRNTIHNEIYTDKKLLSFLFGREITGFAYPFGTYNSEICDVLRENGILYGRTVAQTFEFGLPEEPLTWHPTCHFNNENLENLAERFNREKEQTMLFYVWGHSYELVTEDQWTRFENFCKSVSGRDDVFYGTNGEILNRIQK